MSNAKAKYVVSTSLLEGEVETLAWEVFPWVSIFFSDRVISSMNLRRIEEA